MLKKIVTYTLFAIALAAFGALMWFCTDLRTAGSQEEICTDIAVTIRDSTINRLVSPVSVREMITRLDDPVGKKISDIDVRQLEEGLKGMGAILHSDAAIDRNGIIFVEVTQRHPILRFQSGDRGYYMDDTGFCFPLSDLFTSDVPIVSGAIPEEDTAWMGDILELGRYLDTDRFWHTEVEQIDVDTHMNLTIYTRTSDQTIIFGAPRDIGSKFTRLFSYYKNIAPNYGWDHYSTVNLSYSGQIVCIPKEKH